MVSKTSVIAVVLLVACPILIGYAMAFDEVERDVWDADRTRAVNGLLNNDTAWTWIIANTYQLNGIDSLRDVMDHRMSPYYNSIASSPYTTIEVAQTAYSANATITPSGSGTVYFDDPSSAGTLHITYLEAGVNVTYNQALTYSASWNGSTVYGMYQDPYGVNIEYQFDNVVSFSFDKATHIQATTTGTYADPAKGWTVNQTLYEAYSQLPVIWGYPDMVTDNVIITVDFGPVLANLTPLTPIGFQVYPYTNGLVSSSPFYITMYLGDGTPAHSSYMEINGTRVITNQTIGGTFTTTGNVWQFEFTLDGGTAYYVKDWPNQIGRAQAYQILEVPFEYASDSDPRVTEIYGILMEENATYRVDYAHVHSSSYPVINNVTWDPNDLLQDDNMSYRITFGSGQIGNSISWGGETYTITDGKISVNNVKIKVSDLQLDSRYKDGTRTNYINGREISTGANQLELSGTWGAVVSLSELSYSTVTSTEWQPGVFAWNGVDSSFALMGLITCVGVFIGLGMYGRRSGAKVGTLMLICGGAALIFLALI